MPDERRAQGPKPVLRTRPATMLTAIGLCAAHHGHTAGAAKSVTSAPASAGVRHGRRAITLLHTARALVRPPGNAHLEARLRVPMSFDNVQALPPGTRLGDYRLDAMIRRRLWHHLPRFRHAARQDRRDQGIPAARMRHPPEPTARSVRAQCALGRRLYLGPRTLSRRGPRAGTLPSSSYRTGAALLRGQWHGLYRHGVRGRQERGRALAQIQPPPANRRRAAAWPTGCCAGLGAVHAAGLPSSRHQAVQTSSSGATAFPSSSISAPRVEAMGEPHAQPDQRAHAAICADRTIRARRQAGVRGATSTLPPPSSIMRSPGQTPPDACRERRLDPYRPLAETEGDRFEPAFWPRSTGRWPSRRTTGRRASRSGARCSTSRRPGPGRADATPCLRGRRRAAAPGRCQP